MFTKTNVCGAAINNGVVVKPQLFSYLQQIPKDYNSRWGSLVCIFALPLFGFVVVGRSMAPLIVNLFHFEL